MKDYKKEENEEIITEFEISKRDMECFVGGIFTILLFVMLLWILETYSHINWGW